MSSSSSLNNITVAGGAGGLGKYVVQELVNQGFEVTILSRSSSKDNTPQGVTVKPVDYDDLASLQRVLSGQDAVVSVLGSPALGAQQQNLANAAFAAGVKRFIPSEFGINTRALHGAPISKIVAGKISLVDDLTNKAAQNPNFTWTGVSNGMFFNFLGVNAKDKTFTVVDSGNERFQTTTQGTIAKAVAAILKKPKETANQYLRISSFQPTQQELLKIAEEETGAKFTVVHENTAELQKLGEEKLAKGDYSAFSQLLRVHLYRDGEGHPVKEGDLANKLLGLPVEDLREAVRKTYLS